MRPLSDTTSPKCRLLTHSPNWHSRGSECYFVAERRDDCFYGCAHNDSASASTATVGAQTCQVGE